jgi:hypothetical protein
MSEFEQEVRDRLARRAERVAVRPDMDDLQQRIKQSEQRRRMTQNGLGLVGAAASIIAVVVIATVVTRSEPTLVSTKVTTTVPVTTTTLVKVGHAESQIKINQVFTDVFDAKLPDALRIAEIDQSAGLDAVVERIRREAPPGTLDTIQVNIISFAFATDTKATVRFRMTSSDVVHFPGQRDFDGVAVLRDGEWKMTRGTFCSVIAVVNVSCGGAPTTKSP